MLKNQAIFKKSSLPKAAVGTQMWSSCQHVGLTAAGSSPITSSALSFHNSSKVMKHCLRRWSTRSWTWYSCFCPSTVWKSSTSIPRTAKVSCPWTSPSWPTTCPWPSCFSELGPRRAPTVSIRSLFLCVFRTLPVHQFAVLMCPTFQTLQKSCLPRVFTCIYAQYSKSIPSNQGLPSHKSQPITNLLRHLAENSFTSLILQPIKV